MGGMEFRHVTAPDWPHISLADHDAYLAVIDAAIAVHVDRERVRRGLWKEYPAKDQLNQIKVKIDRILRTLEILENVTDPDEAQALLRAIVEEGYDIINYTVFGIRQIEGTV